MNTCQGMGEGVLEFTFVYSFFHSRNLSFVCGANILFDIYFVLVFVNVYNSGLEHGERCHNNISYTMFNPFPKTFASHFAASFCSVFYAAHSISQCAVNRSWCDFIHFSYTSGNLTFLFSFNFSLLSTLHFLHFTRN